jgi:hypothetical protein
VIHPAAGKWAFEVDKADARVRWLREATRPAEVIVVHHGVVVLAESTHGAVKDLLPA